MNLKLIVKKGPSASKGTTGGRGEKTGGNVKAAEQAPGGKVKSRESSGEKTNTTGA